MWSTKLYGFDIALFEEQHPHMGVGNFNNLMSRYDKRPQQVGKKEENNVGATPSLVSQTFSMMSRGVPFNIAAALAANGTMRQTTPQLKSVRVKPNGPCGCGKKVKKCQSNEVNDAA